METFFKELKQARESKHISLSDISDATLINVHLLEEMERGNVGILPQTYVRAFLREYAAVVGLDPDAVLRNFEATLHTKAEPSPKATGR